MHGAFGIASGMGDHFKSIFNKQVLECLALPEVGDNSKISVLLDRPMRVANVLDPKFIMAD